MKLSLGSSSAYQFTSHEVPPRQSDDKEGKVGERFVQRQGNRLATNYEGSSSAIRGHPLSALPGLSQGAEFQRPLRLGNFCNDGSSW